MVKSGSGWEPTKMAPLPTNHSDSTARLRILHEMMGYVHSMYNNTEGMAKLEAAKVYAECSQAVTFINKRM